MHLSCILPAHNEGESIRATLMEIDRAASRLAAPISKLSVFVSEDGSTDQTRDEVLVAAAAAVHCDIQLAATGPRLGYSRAMLRGLRETTGDLVWFMDADGQYDPSDVWSLIPMLAPQAIAIGYRNPRMDGNVRKAYSAAFRVAYRIFGGPRLKDPSSPFVLARRDDLLFLEQVEPHLEYGFWWEFQTRCAAAGLIPVEVPITHRERTSGETQVYRWQRLPGIVAGHLRGLRRLQQELKDA